MALLLLRRPPLPSSPRSLFASPSPSSPLPSSPSRSPSCLAGWFLPRSVAFSEAAPKKEEEEEEKKEAAAAVAPPSPPDFTHLLLQCGRLCSCSLDAVKRIHSHLVSLSAETPRLGNLLAQAYTRCGALGEAERLLLLLGGHADAVSWNILAAGFIRSRRDHSALGLLPRMQHSGAAFDKFTAGPLLAAAANLQDLPNGRLLHALSTTRYLNHCHEVETAMITMYSKCNGVRYAHAIFNTMSRRDLVAWTSLIAAYTRTGQPSKEPLTLFERMESEDGIKPDNVAFLIALDACGSLVATATGRLFHARIVAVNIQLPRNVQTALLQMYGKCGCLTNAKSIFDTISHHDIVSWTSMIAAYASKGYAEEAITLFEKPISENLKPDKLTFGSILNACSQSGLLSKGRQYFASMIRVHGIIPTVEHCGCMVSLLGRVGQLEEAEFWVNKMPTPSDAITWKTLLAACRNHGDVNRGARIANHLFNLYPDDPAPYIMLMNIYAAALMWNDVASVRSLMENRGLKKEQGRSFIVLKNKVHEFVVGDTSHPKLEEIHAELKKIRRCMEEEASGWISNSKVASNHIEERANDRSCVCHSVQLAIAFGLISTPLGTPLSVVKNLRMCYDCHAATSFISKLAGRVIIVKDANSFHQFKQGRCSCGDYW